MIEKPWWGVDVSDMRGCWFGYNSFGKVGGRGDHQIILRKIKIFKKDWIEEGITFRKRKPWQPESFDIPISQAQGKFSRVIKAV